MKQEGYFKQKIKPSFVQQRIGILSDVYYHYWRYNKKVRITSIQIVDKDAYSEPHKVYITPTISEWVDDLGRIK